MNWSPKRTPWQCSSWTTAGTSGTKGATGKLTLLAGSDKLGRLRPVAKTDSKPRALSSSRPAPRPLPPSRSKASPRSAHDSRSSKPVGSPRGVAARRDDCSSDPQRCPSVNRAPRKRQGDRLRVPDAMLVQLSTRYRDYQTITELVIEASSAWRRQSRNVSIPHCVAVRQWAQARENLRLGPCVPEPETRVEQLRRC